MFLKLATSQSQAWDLGNPRVTSYKYAGQLHLKPYDPKPYIQITDSDTDLVFNDLEYTAGLVDSCGNFYDLEDHIDLLQIIDQNNTRQIYIRLRYLPYEFNGELVGLRIASVKDEVAYTYFSNPFLLTIDEIDKTTRIDYRITQDYDFSQAAQELSLFYQGIRVGFYYNDYIPATDVSNYYQISTSLRINPRIAEEDHKQWIMEYADAFHLKRLQWAMYRSAFYLDFIRNYGVEPVDKEQRSGDANFGEAIILTNEDLKDVIFIPDSIPDEPLQLFLASSDTFASSDYLVSQEYI